MFRVKGNSKARRHVVIGRQRGIQRRGRGEGGWPGERLFLAGRGLRTSTPQDAAERERTKAPIDHLQEMLWKHRTKRLFTDPSQHPQSTAFEVKVHRSKYSAEGRARARGGVAGGGAESSPEYYTVTGERPASGTPSWGRKPPTRPASRARNTRKANHQQTAPLPTSNACAHGDRPQNRIKESFAPCPSRTTTHGFFFTRAVASCSLKKKKKKNARRKVDRSKQSER